MQSACLLRTIECIRSECLTGYIADLLKTKKEMVHNMYTIKHSNAIQIVYIYIFNVLLLPILAIKKRTQQVGES
jgi:uncharacterized membrane protein